MRHYLYVADAEGREVPGSRRSIDACETRDQLAKIEAELQAASGEDCTVNDNVEDWRAFWSARQPPDIRSS